MSKGRNVEASKDRVMDNPKETLANLNEEQLSIYVAEEIKKLKVSLSTFDLLRVPSIRNAKLGAYNVNFVSQEKSGSESVNRVSSSQIVGRKNQTHNQVHVPPRDKGKEKDRTQVAEVDTPLTLFQVKT